jgi:hypothetical protein
MEISEMDQHIDELKKIKKAKSAVMLKRWKEALECLEELENQDKTIYVNGASEELKKYCLVTKEKIKIKEEKGE